MNRDLFRRYAQYFWMLADVKGRLAGGLIAGVISGAVSGFGFPFLVYKVLPVVFSEKGKDPRIMVGAIALLPTVTLLRGLTGFVSTYLLTFCSVHMLNKLRMEVHRKIQSLPLAFFHRNKIGDLYSRIMQDTGQLQSAIMDSSINLIKLPVQMVGALVALIYLSIKQHEVVFFLLFMAVIPLVVVPIRFVGKKLLKRATQLQREMGATAQVVSENLNAVREVRAFNLQDREAKRLERTLGTLLRYMVKTTKYKASMRPTIEMVNAVGVSVAIGYVLISGMAWENVVALLVALFAAYEPVKKLGTAFGKLKQGEASLERIEYILEQEEDVADPEEPLPLDEVKGEIEFRDVWFRYDEEWILRDLNLTAPAKAVTALVGASGAGKSTMADLVPRFYDVQKGAVLVDGRDVRSVRKRELRSHVAIVSQRTFLFNATIEENIRLGRLDATPEDVREAARHAFAHEFIMEMEKGYDTIVGDRGIRLSGGQAQRIAIARAFLKKSPILILDEATSALDSESEELIQRSLEELVEGRTVLVIAHRFSTIRNADRIAVLERGVLVGCGSHEELYPVCEVYRNLYDRQFGEGEEAETGTK